MSIPIMFGASALKLVKAFLDGFQFTASEVWLLLVEVWLLPLPYLY